VETEDKTIRDYIEIARRRKKSLILPFLLVVTVAVVAAVVIPPQYKSTSTILIEEQEIPREYVVSTINSYAEQRLQSINQQVISTTKLLEIINKYNLYSDLKKRLTNEEIVDKMRKNIKFETVSAEVDDKRAGRSAKVTIAFTISYMGRSPVVVQQIANVLASLYLEENLKVRGQQSQGAAKFFDEEMKDVQGKIADLDSRIASYKGRNVDALPELAQANFQELARIEQVIDQQNEQLRGLKERESSLKSQLDGLPSDTEVQNRNHLNELRVKLVNLKTRVTDDYPDVAKLKQEIADLEKKLTKDNQDPSIGRNETLGQISVASALSGTRAEMEAVKRQIALLTAKKNDYRRRIEISPRVEEGFRTLSVERAAYQSKFDDLSRKSMEANVARGLEKEQMGEKFTLIDAARLPEMPVKPNIPAILLIGLVLGIGSGAGVTAMNEMGDKAVYSTAALAALMPYPVVCGIPEIVTPRDIASRKKRKRLFVVGILLAIVVAVLLFHFLIMDLDVFWARLTRKLS